MIGSYDFFCKNGWESDNYGRADTVCVDVDKCRRFDTDLAPFAIVDVDVDECDASASLNHARDVNVDRSEKDGSYVCFYNRGLESNSDGQFDTVALTSVNVTPMPALITPAMLFLPAPTMTFHMTNTSGSYIFYCNLGWESDNYGQVDTVCGDVDECDAGLSIDHAFDTNSACSDTYGFYDCFCNLG